MQDNVRNGVTPMGERHHWSKLSESDVQAIIGSMETSKVLAARFGISKGNVDHIRRGASWKESTKTKRPRNYRKAGEGANQAKLTNEQAIEIATSTDSISVLARRFGVSWKAVSNLRKGITWGKVTGIAPEIAT